MVSIQVDEGGCCWLEWRRLGARASARLRPLALLPRTAARSVYSRGGGCASVPTPYLTPSNGLCRTSCVSHASVHAIAAPVLGGPEVVRVIVLNKRFRSRPIDLRYRLHPRPGRGWSRASHLNSDHHDVIWCGKSSHDGPKQRSCERCEGIGKSVRVRARARRVRVRAAAPARAPAAPTTLNPHASGLPSAL